MKIRVIAALILLCALLSSCMKIEQNTEDLMRPPKLSVEQENIFSALGAAVGQNIILKFPNEGEHRSAFVMYDIDDDGEDEAIVFYTSETRGTDLHINILDKQNGTWFSMYDSEGYGPEIESISFPRMTSDKRRNIAVAFDITRQSKVLAIYSFKDQQLIEEFNCEFSNSIIQDFDNDGRDEIFLLDNLYESGASQAKLIDTTYLSNKVAVADTVELRNEITEFVQLSVEKSAYSNTVKSTDTKQSTVSQSAPEAGPEDNSYNIYIDGKKSNGIYYTQIIGIHNNRLKNLLLKQVDDKVLDYSVQTNRNVLMLTKDINDDGLFEIPAGVAIPDAPIVNEESMVTLIQWFNFIDDSLYPSTYTLVNGTFKFSFDYPSTWGDNISVKQQSDGFEWKFYEYEAKKKQKSTEGTQKGELGDELLRIRAYPNNDFVDDYSVEGYTPIGKNEQYSYYAFFPTFSEDKKNDLAITLEEFTPLFHY